MSGHSGGARTGPGGAALVVSVGEGQLAPVVPPDPLAPSAPVLLRAASGAGRVGGTAALRPPLAASPDDCPRAQWG
eukprot:3289175-Lingulodinium_polyedra.AAC.1